MFLLGVLIMHLQPYSWPTYSNCLEDIYYLPSYCECVFSKLSLYYIVVLEIHNCIMHFW